MGIFKTDMNADELKRLEEKIEGRLEERMKLHDGFADAESKLASPVVNYSDCEMPDVPYELFRAREYVKMFPEEDIFAPKRFSGIRRFYHRVVRRLLRQQIVYNEFILGAVEELNKKLVSLEEKVESLKNTKAEKGGENDSK